MADEYTLRHLNRPQKPKKRVVRQINLLILQGDKKVSLGLRLLLNLNYSFWFGTNNAIPPMHLIHKMEIIILAKENK